MSSRKIENPEQFRLNIRGKLNEIIENEKHSTNLEKGMFNYALKEASSRKVVKKWDNQYFVQIYIDRLNIIISKSAFRRSTVNVKRCKKCKI